MSQWRERFEDDSNLATLTEYVTNWYHIPSLLFLVAFMFWARARTWGKFVNEDGTVLFSGNDPWYHFRQVSYTVKHWPETMPYDVWTNYPQGTSVSQFGTIFDQAIATVALIVGLGDPSEQTIAMTLLFAPAAIGALITIPTYYLGKRLGGRLSGVLAALIVALSTGVLLQRSLVGSADHHVAEAFTQALAILAIVVAIQVADREKPVWELVVDRDIAGLRKPLVYGALAGLGTALYIWTWPPGVLLVGILGLYFTAQIAINYLRDESPEHIAIVGVTLFVVTAVLTLLPLDEVGIATVKFSLLQPGLALLGAGWLVFLSWLSRTWDDQSYPAWTYPIAAVTTILAALGLIALVFPDVFGFLVNNIKRVLVPGTTGGRAGTVGEVQPFPIENLRGALYNWYGLAGFIAGGGVLLAIAQQFVSEEQRSEVLLVAFWFGVMLLASLTQSRFLYYLTVPVAALTAYVIGFGVKYLQSVAGDSSFETYQILAVVTVIMLVIVPMFAATSSGQPQHVFNQTDERHNAAGGVIGWDNSLQWMENNTPTEGTYAGANNEMNPWETYPNMEDFDYPAGSYGVISWWDYGHWITAHGNRTPVANPFQQHAQEAAEFLLADDEDEAADVLSNLSDGENRETRYVMVDWKMVEPTSKFTAPVTFHPDLNNSDMFETIYQQTQNGLRGVLPVRTQRYYESMMVRLYHYHGSEVRPGNVVVNYENRTTTTQSGEQVTRKVLPPLTSQNQSIPPVVRKFSSARARNAYLEEDNTSHLGGIGIQPRDTVEALEHYRLVKADTFSAFSSGQYFSTIQRDRQLNSSLTFSDFVRNPSWTKVFERVPGATVEGSGAPANATVTAQVVMNEPSQGQPFLYRQSVEADADGNFEMTLPYSSSGYDNWGPSEGYANTSVRAQGPYQFSTRPTFQGTSQVFYNATANVSEAKVIGEDDSPLDISLTRAEIPLNISQPTQNGSDTNGTDTSGSLVGPESVSTESTGTATAPSTDAPALPDLSARIAG